MAYNNYYPATYQSPVMYSQTPYQLPQMPLQNSQQSGQGIQWVQGEVGARAYPVAPGSSVLLMDSDESRFYIKSADASGMPLPLRMFSYTEEVAQQSHAQVPEMDTSQFITRDEFEELKESIRSKKGEK